MEAKYKVFALLSLCMMMNGIPAYAQWIDAQQISTTNKSNNYQTSNYQSTSYQTYVIHTYGGSSLIPAVRQTLDGIAGGSTVSSYQDKLVLRTTPAGYEAATQLLKQIDGAAKAVTISVSVGQQQSRDSAITQGQVIINSDGVSGIGNVSQQSDYAHSNSLYQVKTLIGKSSFIGSSTLFSLADAYMATLHIGFTPPVNSIHINGQILTTAMQGVSITPALLPDGQVQLTISQVEDTLTHQLRTPIQSQQLSTTVVVPKGQWVTIGDINRSSLSQQSDNQRNVKIQVKVD